MTVVARHIISAGVVLREHRQQPLFKLDFIEGKASRISAPRCVPAACAA
jgi:hypothetical protein